MQLNVNTLCANEFALAIALTVFIILTVILTVLLISLAASKGFRTVFFREKTQKKKSTKKPAASEPAQSEPQEIEAVVEQPKPRRAAPRKSAQDSAPDYLSGIPTVPLGGFPQATPSPARGRSRNSVRAVEASDANEQGDTYTTRSITITRARSTRPTDSDSDKTENGQTSRSTKKR